jgi:hypothetical protein
MRKGAWLATCICGIAILVTSVYVITKDVSSKPKTIAIPGTGVTMTLPEGVTISPIGTIFANDAKDVTIAVSVAPSFRNATTLPSLRAHYPDQVESFRSSELSGVLYKGTRAESGGAWDGWWLEVIRGDQVLDLKIFYSGSSPEKFLELKKYLSTASWNDKILDPEAAFGLKLEVPNLQLARAGAGSALMYNQDGRPYPGAQYIVLDAIPNNYHGNISMLRRLCESRALTITHGQPVSVRYQTKNQIVICDVWDSTTSSGHEYFAALMLSNGWIVTTHGHGDPDAFQQALLGLHIIPR